ncbi:MAG: helix-turn-helix domain-containing protein [Nitrosomonas sp.]|nr:helix-turn-helix domain-containing protein [Nitrosomonas sp.]MBP6076943.1 helix-turn-helix domain-containing protein [Nitrosomonas sp.]
MLTQEILVEIHVLHRQGKSIRSIARALNVSRNTVVNTCVILPEHPPTEEGMIDPQSLSHSRPICLSELKRPNPVL